MLEYIHNLCLCNVYDDVVDGCLAHSLVYILNGSVEGGSLYEEVHSRALLLGCLLVEGDEGELSLVPVVVVVVVAEENLAVRSRCDVLYLKLAAYVWFHFLSDSLLGLAEAQGVYNI